MIGKEIGCGSERKCYIKALDPCRCLKISKRQNSDQTIREIKYFEFLQKRGIEASFIPKFYGAFETDDCIGYEQECFLIKENGGIYDDVLPFDRYILSKPNEIEKIKIELMALKSEMVNKPLLRALIFCTDCGRRYICNSGRSIYACQTRFDNIRANYVADCHSAGISATNIEPIIWNLVERLFKSTIASSKAQERIEPYQEQLSKLSESKNNFEMQRDKINKDAAKLFDTLLLIRDTNPTVFTSKMEDFNKMSTEANDYQKEIDIIESKKQAIQRRIKAIEEIKDIDITDESEKYDILHKVIEAIKIYSVKTNQKVFTVLFASGLEYNVLYNVNKPKFRIEYAFASDETITFNKKDKLLINKLYSSVRDILPDFSITAGNNDMFDNDVCGDYSFQEVWDLLEKYNKTEVLREWKPDYTKRTINRRSKK